MSAGSENIFSIAGISHEYSHVAGSALVAIGLTALGLHVKSKLSKPDAHLLPEAKFSMLNFSTLIVSGFRDLVNNIVGHHSEKYVPFVGATFLYILLMNLMGLIPGFLPPSENINTNLSMGLAVFLFYNYLGLKEHGLHYGKQFTAGLPGKGHAPLLAIFLSLIAGAMVLIESIGHIIRPFSLSLRLWGNINGDHTLVGVFNGLLPALVPIPFMLLGVFVCCVQAFVFSLLSTVYIKLAVSHDH